MKYELKHDWINKKSTSSLDDREINSIQFFICHGCFRAYLFTFWIWPIARATDEEKIISTGKSGEKILYP